MGKKAIRIKIKNEMIRYMADGLSATELTIERLSRMFKNQHTTFWKRVRKEYPEYKNKSFLNYDHIKHELIIDEAGD